MNFYHKHVLPKLINSAMGKSDLVSLRQEAVRPLSGVVLEIGFGSGKNIPYFQNITKLYALDPSKELYDLSETNRVTSNIPIEYLQASAEKIPLADNSVDSVLSTWSLCSIPHPEKALSEIVRVLKKGGVFSFIEHGKSTNVLAFRLQNILTPLSRSLAGNCHLNRDLEDLVKNSNLNIQKIRKFPIKHKPLAFMYEGLATK